MLPVKALMALGPIKMWRVENGVPVGANENTVPSPGTSGNNKT